MPRQALKFQRLPIPRYFPISKDFVKEQIAAAKMTEPTTLVNFCADQIQQNFSQLSEWHSGSGQRQGLTFV
jgi:hypothetical protein